MNRTPADAPLPDDPATLKAIVATVTRERDRAARQRDEAARQLADPENGTGTFTVST